MIGRPSHRFTLVADMLAFTVKEGSPLVRRLAAVIYNGMAGLLDFL